MATVNLTILGLGRLGASFGLALKRYAKTPGAKHQFVITGYDEKYNVTQAARKAEAVDHEARNAGAAVAKADLVILAARYGLYDSLYQTFGPELKPGAVILDFSPLKVRAIARAAEYLPHDEEGNLTAFMVGATAILNPEVLLDSTIDPASARADLFDNGTLLLAPAVDCRGEAVELASDLGTLLGMTVHFADPAEHDGLIGVMEALPLLAGLGLFRAAHQNPAWDDLRRLGNPAFALATLGLDQYAADDAAAFFAGDRERTAQTLDTLIKSLSTLRTLLTDDDPHLIEAAFEDAITRREQWLHARRSNKWSTKTEVKPTETISLMGVIGTHVLPRGMRPNPKDSDKNK